MTTLNGSKINSLINKWPHSAVYACSYLEKLGISHDLLKIYRKTHWLKPVGRGAVAKASDEIDWTGGLYAIQSQLKLPIHIGAKTALEMHGAGHFVPAQKGYRVILFGKADVKLPSWFKGYDWGVRLFYTTPALFPGAPELGITESDRGFYKVRVSSRERAMLETLHLVPEHQEFEESKLLMENLLSLRPKMVQSLLESCRSIKAKRLFMLLAELCNHPWVSKLDLKKVNFGKGKRMITKGGVFNNKYGISVPRIHEGGSES